MTSHTIRFTLLQTGSGTDWELGVYSQVTSLPRNFTHRTLMVGGAGLTDTLATYGALVMRLAGTNKTAATTADVVVNKLGYVRVEISIPPAL